MASSDNAPPPQLNEDKHTTSSKRVGKKIRFQILTNWSLINNYTKSLETYSISIIKVKSKIKSKDRTRRKQTVK
jgi:hypothetical protein